MAAFEKLQSMLDAAMKQAGEESSMLLGQSLTARTDAGLHYSGRDE